jgi:probable HAF family extracellular repeat protein
MVQNGLQKDDITNERKEIIMMTRQSTTRWLGLALACGTFTSAVAGQAAKPPPVPTGPTYRIVALGTLGGSTVSLSAINGAGWVAGGSSSTAVMVVPEASANGPVYFRDTSPADGVNDLIQELPGLSTLGCYAHDINDAGLVVGSSSMNDPNLWYQQATLWLGETPTGLGFLDGYGGKYDSIAYAVNNQGLIAIGTWESGEAPAAVLVPRDTDGDNVPDTWFEDADGDGFNDLFLVVAPRLYGPPPDEWPIARFTPAGINDIGQMIVNRWESGTAYRLTPDYTDADGDGNPWFADVNVDGYNDLLVQLNGLSGAGSYATDINAAGQVVGSSNRRAVLWNFTGGAQTVKDLGLLSKSVRSMAAAAINDAGQIVGTATFQNSRTTFLVYKGTMYDLATRLTNGTGWANLTARDINSQGSIIGYGDFGGVRQSFVAIPVTQP